MRTNRLGHVPRRAFLAGGAALLAAGPSGRASAAEFALAIPPGDLPAADGPLRYLDIGDQHAVFYESFFAAYGEARGIEVVFDGLPWREIATVVPLGVRNGTAPDAFVLPLGMPPAVAVASGWVRPLDDLVADFAAWRAGFPAGSFIEGVNVIDGRTYGLPYTSDRRSSSLLLFGTEAMALTEFDPGPDAPLTWDEFRAAARQITRASKGRVPGLIVGGAQVNRWGDNTINLAQRAGAACGPNSAGFVTGVDYRTGEIVVDAPEFVAAVELLLAIRDDGSTFPGLLSLTAPQARALVAQGAAGMILQGPWNVQIWEETVPEFGFGLAATPAPKGKDGRTFAMALPAIADMLYVNAKARNPYHAADVFRILGTPEGQAAWARVASPSNPALFPEANAAADLSEKARAVLALQEAQVKIAPIPYARNPDLATVSRLYKAPVAGIGETVQGLFSGQLSGVRESLAALKERMNAALDDAFVAAKAEGATATRADLVFPDWDITRDYLS